MVNASRDVLKYLTVNSGNISFEANPLMITEKYCHVFHLSV
jgi:hypothetical protein